MNTKLVAGILIAAMLATSIGVASAGYGQENGSRYMDANGDGVCDNIGMYGRDSDGDGTQNGKDIDFVQQLRDGSGKHQHGNGRGR
ncbi:hypothetical protein C5S35_11565 [Candidatus Methanophagaceae archaeon]|nr:hypothetical protein C5S35_11565 [Methanophagales archaeon]